MHFTTHVTCSQPFLGFQKLRWRCFTPRTGQGKKREKYTVSKEVTYLVDTGSTEWSRNAVHSVPSPFGGQTSTSPGPASVGVTCLLWRRERPYNTARNTACCQRTDRGNICLDVTSYLSCRRTIFRAKEPSSQWLTAL